MAPETAPRDLTDPDLVAAYPSLTVDRDTAEYYRGWAQRELRVRHCTECGHTWLPFRPVCPRCWSFAVDHVAVRGDGTIHLLMLLHQGPAASGVDYTLGPWPVATVEFADHPGVRVTTTIVDAEPHDLAVGQPVTLTWFERDGMPHPAFRPTGESAA